MDLVRTHPTAGVDDVADLEAIELACSPDRICAHVVESKPIPDLEGSRKHGLGRYTVDGIAGRSPYAAHMGGLRSRNVEGPVHGENVWVDDLVVEEDAIECSVDPIVDVICDHNPSIKDCPLRQGAEDLHITFG